MFQFFLNQFDREDNELNIIDIVDYNGKLKTFSFLPNLYNLATIFVEIVFHVN